MGLRAGLDWCGKSRPTWIRSPDRPARRQSLYRLRYPAHRLTLRHVNNVETEIQTRARNCTYYTLSVSTKKLTLRVTTRYSSSEEGEAVVPAGLEVLSSRLQLGEATSNHD